VGGAFAASTCPGAAAGVEPAAGEGVLSALPALEAEDACGTASPKVDGFAPFGPVWVLAAEVGGGAGA
jgi:hypothetical protein